MTYSKICIYVDVFLFIPAVFGPNKLLCSDDNFFVAINPEESTFYCQMLGQFIINNVCT